MSELSSIVREKMIEALKSGNKDRKETLSMLLQALNNAKIANKIGILSTEEENAIVMKEIKQTMETLESAPVSRTDIIDACNLRLEILNEFAPKMLTEKEINNIIDATIEELGLSNPTKKEKGKIMKVLMPKVKGVADGKLVNTLLNGRLL